MPYSPTGCPNEATGPARTGRHCSSTNEAAASPPRAGDIITAIATDAHLDGEGVSAHPLRHTFVTTLVRGGTDLVTVAELAGHARLEITRAYSLPTDEDKTKALNLLITDQ